MERKKLSMMGDKASRRDTECAQIGHNVLLLIALHILQLPDKEERIAKTERDDNYRSSRTCAMASVSEWVIVRSELFAFNSANRRAAPP
jgi:hypothetical protein